MASEDDDLLSFLGLVETPKKSEPKKAMTPIAVGGNAEAFLALQNDIADKVKETSLRKRWMKFHRFTLVKTVEEVRALVDRALAHGRCSLDLETGGFDNRIDYVDGRPRTKHQIVGYAISVRGHGHYIPVRHHYDANYEERDPNVPVESVEQEITRLCRASQPVLTPEGLADDPLGSKAIQEPGKVIVYFANAKFDQEFLYPVTGIDFWHPSSFEDAELAIYAVHSDADLGLKDNALRFLKIKDPETKEYVPYEMINYDELFPPNTPRRERKIATRYPDDDSDIVVYGCSDAICTELLCEHRKTDWEHTQPGLEYDYREVVSAVIESKYTFTYRLEKQTVQVIRVMERNRSKIDRAEIQRLLTEAEAELATLLTEIRKVGIARDRTLFAELNPGSPKQLSDFLFSERGLDLKPKPNFTEAKQQYETNAKVLEKLGDAPGASKVLTDIIKYKQIDKIKGTYLQGMLDTCDDQDQLRYKFNQLGAITGRFTAPQGDTSDGYAGIPIQGIPVRDDPKKPKVAHSLRRAFIARDGYTLVKCDYSGQELRISTNLSGEDVWINEFLHGTGDIHTITAKNIFGPHITKKDEVERDKGKRVNFSILYGGGIKAVQRNAGCAEHDAARWIEQFLAGVPKIEQWIKKQHAFVKANKGVYSAFRRWIEVPGAAIKEGDLSCQRCGHCFTPKKAETEPCSNCGEKIRLAVIDKKEAWSRKGSAERESVNYPVQATGADIMKVALVLLTKAFRKLNWDRYYDQNWNQLGDDRVRMILTVHDEIVFEIKHQHLMEVIPVVIELMEYPSQLLQWKVPLVVDVSLGLNWGSKIAWDKVISKKTPVPEWLVEFVTPDALPEKIPAGLPLVPTISSTATTFTPPAASVSTVRAASPVDPLPKTATNGIQKPVAKKIARFVLCQTYLTEASVRLTYEAVAGSLQPGGDVLLCLVDQHDNVLIDPLEKPIPIDPVCFGHKMADRGLGPVTYVLT
jgi:DNA polymerase I-like protein with 3'-5' exonuclease and polymerase domains